MYTKGVLELPDHILFQMPRKTSCISHGYNVTTLFAIINKWETLKPIRFL